MARSTAEVKQEYTNIVLKAGSLQYEILVKKDDLTLVNNRLKELNQEFIQASNTEVEVAKKLAEAKSEKEAAESASTEPSSGEQPNKE